MRGIIRGVALLSPALALGFVLPDVIGERQAVGGVIDYLPSTATITFAIDGVVSRKALTLHVIGTDQACGASSIEINGQLLESKWEGLEAHGQAFLDGLSNNEAIWSITCLYNSLPSDGGFSNGEDVVHLLRLHFEEPNTKRMHGFTISYRQKERPGIVRFIPSVIEFEDLNQLAPKWRTPSLEFDPDFANILPGVDNDGSLIRPKAGQETSSLNSIKHSFAAFGGLIKNKLSGAIKVLGSCKQKVISEPVHKSLEMVLYQNHTRKLNEQIPDHDQSDTTMTPTVKSNGTTGTVQNLAAAETRSLSLLDEGLDASTHSLQSPTSNSTSSFDSETDNAPLKSFMLTLTLFMILLWVYLRFMDPRRRVDRATRREERRNKRLYKRAARLHALKTWVRHFRLRFRLVNSEALTWDEKRNRVMQQEQILNAVTDDEIQAIGHAHWNAGGITAAEEGRFGADFDPEGSDRGRSVSTLPGYESDCSEPPSYDEASRSYARTRTMDTSVSSPGYNHSSRSSIISTSPRISRDGTNSDFDEKIEALSLEQIAAIEAPRIYNHI